MDHEAQSRAGSQSGDAKLAKTMSHIGEA